MGKNKNRNRRNKKKNASSVETKKVLDVEVSTSSPVEDLKYSSAAKEEASVSIKCTVGDPKICKTQSVSNFNKNCLYSSQISKNFIGTLSKTNVINKHKDGVCQAAGRGKIVSGDYYSTKSAGRVQTSINDKKVQPLDENNYSGNVQPLMKSNYEKDFPCIKNNVKTQNIIQNNKFSTNYRDKAFNRDTPTSHNKSTLGSESSMKGARPKAQQLKMLASSNVYVSQYTKDVQNFNQRIQGNMKRNENHWEHFKRLYSAWKIERRNTIQKLRKLVNEVHKDQMMFNQGNATLKEWNIGSREVKNLPVSPAVDFLASLAAFVTDAASSVTSVIQACNVDNYATMFKEILEKDAEVTKPLYEARSQCLVEYWKVEEIMRKCHSDTFGSTIGNISSALKVEDLWMDIKNAKGENSVGQIIDSIDLFLRRNANVEKMGDVYNSIQGYLNSNPAALEACKYAGRALYDVFDTWSRDPKQKAGIANNVSMVTNRYFLKEEKKELDHLRSVADNDEEIQAKLESDIHITISSLEHELEEISNIFTERSQIHNNSPWCY